MRTTVLNTDYILVTVVYNEENRLPRLIETVMNQKIKPLKWMIVSDGSTDRTDEIIQNSSKTCDSICYGRQEKKREYEYRLEKVTIAQARAMELARDLFRNIDYGFIGNLDVDITLVPDYYERLIKRCASDPGLGIVGGGVYNMDKLGIQIPGGFLKPEFVGGPIQLFRKACSDDIGGYALYGHADVIAIVKAKMRGWKVRCYPEIRAFQHEMPRYTFREKIPDCFEMGKFDYIMGSLFIFQASRVFYNIFRKPYVIAAVSLWAGYCWAFLSGQKKTVPIELRVQMHKEQLEKMKNLFKMKRTL